MASSQERSSDTPEVMRLAGCGTWIVGGFILLLGVAWLVLYLIFSPSLWKTVIGEVTMPGGHKLSIGRAHDGDISYNYYVRVSGAGDYKLEDWTYVGWSIDPTDDAVTAMTSDSRFAAAEFQSGDGRVLVIYDSKYKELWWNADHQWASTTKFLGAWRQLHAKNSRLSAPP